MAFQPNYGFGLERLKIRELILKYMKNNSVLIIQSSSFYQSLHVDSFLRFTYK